METEAGQGQVAVSRAEHQRNSPPIFASPTLDRLTRVHPAVPLVLFAPVIAILAALTLGRSPLVDAALEFVGGYVAWTLCEYWIHRTILHFEPKGALGARLHWMVHGVHHQHPSDPRRLVLPPAVSIPGGVAFLAIFLALLGRPDGFGVGAGFVVGYVLYDLIHFALHHRRPKSRLGRRLHELHMRHHFQDETRGFGVSAPWWDLVFGTRSPRARRTDGR